jgi:ATP/maltotriose-dependent transcriptional regulator MalT
VRDDAAGRHMSSLVRYLRAILALRRGDADETIALMRESLRQIGELRDRFAFVYALVPLGAAAVLKGDDAWAARILGAREAVTERWGPTILDTPLDDVRKQAERELRDRLGPDQWARAYAAGRTMSIDALLRDIEGVVQKR